MALVISKIIIQEEHDTSSMTGVTKQEAVNWISKLIENTYDFNTDRIRIGTIKIIIEGTREKVI